MAIRYRAMQPEDKHERRHAILDAAQRMLIRSPERVPSVAEVADEAGLAKGTVYLYFSGKEELLLALHERDIDGLFRVLIDHLESQTGGGMDELLDITQRHIREAPLFLPLASRCFGAMAHDIAPEQSIAFGERMTARLQRVGACVERRFPHVRPGHGVALWRWSYALILGLWQMSVARGESTPQLASDYRDELDQALRALWRAPLGSPQ